MKTGIVYHDDYLKHRQVEHHPECPERLETTLEYFLKTGLTDQVEMINPGPAAVEALTRVHSKEHVEYIRCRSSQGKGKFSVIDSDTYICSETYDVALLAAGGVIAAGEAVWKGELDNCFALVRPPGHHASMNQATGFCYFDNTAVMIKHLQANQGLKKVFLFDWDAHAPNGTMGTFYSDPSVLNMSIHQDPRSFYPGHGFVDQIGEGAGKGYTINFPVPGGSGDADFIHFIDEFVMARVKKFKPDMIAVSAGQDSHRDDLISQLQVTDNGYALMTRRFMELADELCGGKLVLALEGGYNLKTLPITHHTITSTLLGVNDPEPAGGEVLDSTRQMMSELRNKLKASTIWPEAPEYGESADLEEGDRRCTPP
ncbi:MAG: histone deacetylase [Candidatus Altiarchaeales archaeon]|nr:histone deacetylase [Candidatus Altiarchaeales archaeon]MBD3416151.1 histone deacetylase [Candidatus Altiarchaeales archaeon]